MTTVKKATENDIAVARRDVQDYNRKRRAKYPPKPEKRICNGCGKEFDLMTHDRRIKSREHVYCSRQCYAEWRRRMSPWMSNPITRTCEREECGNTFVVSTKADRKKRFCSYSCAAQWRIGRQREKGAKIGGYRPKGSKIEL